MVYKYREVRGTFTALTPDTTDADEHPNLVPLEGSVVLTPRFSNGGISFAELGHFDQPQVKRAAIEDGELKAVVVDEETGHLTRQALFLPVTDDDNADQTWSYEATFPEVVRTDTGERVVIPPRRFVVEAGDGPLNLAAVATAQKAGAIVTRGPRGYRVTEVSAANGELVFEWEDGETAAVPMPDSVPGPTPTVEWDGPHLVVEGERGPDLRGPNSIPTEEAVDTVLVERMQGRPISAAAEGAYPGAADLTAKLNAAALKAETAGVPLILAAGDHILDDEFLFGSKTTIEGVRGVTSLTQTTPGKAVMKSRNVAHNGAPAGQAVIRNLLLSGEPTHPESHGIVFRDYLSHLERLIITQCGGDGVHATHFNSSGSPYGGASMVDNRINEVDVRGVHGWGMWIGALDNNKFTDMRISDSYISLGSGAKGGIYGGSTGGWELNNVHTYGQTVPVAIELNNLNGTQLNNIYLESNWSEAAIRIGRLQQGVNLDNLIIKGSQTAGARAVDLLSRSSLVTSADVNIDNLHVLQDNNVPISGVYSPTTTIRTKVGNFFTNGAYAGQVTKFAGNAAPWMERVSDAIVDAPLRDSANGGTLTYKGQPLALTGRIAWSGGGEKSVTIPLPAFRPYEVTHARLGLGSVSNYNGSVRSRWVADLLITSKAPADSWRVYPEVLNTAFGFEVEPTVTVDKATKTMTVTFTPAHADGYGTLGMSLDYH